MIINKIDQMQTLKTVLRAQIEHLARHGKLEPDYKQRRKQINNMICELANSLRHNNLSNADIVDLQIYASDVLINFYERGGAA